MSDYPNKSHDEFFKASFGQLEIARDYLEQLLPKEVYQSLDLSRLERVNGSWVTPEFIALFTTFRLHPHQCTGAFR
ncbi:Rpn family recombination-promoting nuclease/putative transposase [Haliscomenobacter sp.]|uniref:Rpn family recombination-promoting nuclease/putative transposase n=1 Tax=Haliscomenobacter sp. TaxID=2717303 RepID=UPI003BAD200D